jgi:DNA-binding LytR/AlgR family response regulator
MRVRIRTEISSDFDEDEIVIRMKEQSERTRQIEEAIEGALRGGECLALIYGEREYIVEKHRILFFESANGKVYAHTSDRIYTVGYRLFELENLMPSSFVRVSKSVIVNVMQIESMHRELVGNGELTLRGCDKRVYFSRTYFKLLQYKIEEMRLRK